MEFTQINIEAQSGTTGEDTWLEIFQLLDPKDGCSDGQIDKFAFLEWIDTLNFQDTVMLEAKNGISRYAVICYLF